MVVPKTEEERLVFQCLDLLEEYVKELNKMIQRNKKRLGF